MLHSGPVALWVIHVKDNFHDIWTRISGNWYRRTTAISKPLDNKRGVNRRVVAAFDPWQARWPRDGATHLSHTPNPNAPVSVGLHGRWPPLPRYSLVAHATSHVRWRYNCRCRTRMLVVMVCWKQRRSITSRKYSTVLAHCSRCARRRQQNYRSCTTVERTVSHTSASIINVKLYVTRQWKWNIEACRCQILAP